jgi:Endomembrane protein 70
MQAVAEDYYIQMYYDDLPIYGFVGKTEKILHAASADLRHYLYTHTHFEVHYNGNNIIQVSITTDDSQALDVSEDVLPDNSGTLPADFTYSVAWHETPVVFANRLEHFDALSRNPIHLEVCTCLSVHFNSLLRYWWFVCASLCVPAHLCSRQSENLGE